MRNYKVTTLIPARKKTEFFREAEKAENKKAIVDLARKIGKFYAEKNNLSKEDEKTLVLSLFASGLCAWNIKHAASQYDYIVNYILWKQRVYERLNDLGAFGDSVETCVHLINCREKWRVNLKNIHVAAIGNTDIWIKGRRFEIGTNGKSWADSTEEEPMRGPFDGIIYGVISDEEKQYIIDLFRQNKVRQGLTAIAKMLYVFPEKEEFSYFMEKVGRSASIVWKKHLNIYQTVYNPSKHSAFIEKVESENIPTLYEYIKQFGKNEFLTD